MGAPPVWSAFFFSQLQMHGVTVLFGSSAYGKSPSIFLPGFQQIGEKECGKELSCVSKRTRVACSGALHTIRCEDEPVMKFFARELFADKKFLSATKNDCMKVLQRLLWRSAKIQIRKFHFARKLAAELER